MAMVEVNHETLRLVAYSFDTYCDEQDKEMKNAKASLATMFLKDWIGEDSAAFAAKWNEVDSENSTATIFKNNLRNFAECLRTCANIYQTAQEDSYNAAHKLPR